MAAAWKVADLPEKPGMTVTEMLPAAHDGTLKALYIIGENPLVSDADLNHAEKSLRKLDFLVVQDIFLTETAQLADVVLPSACFAEKDGHLLQHRAPGAAGAQGGRAPGRGAR